jgi:acyl carrier protein
VAELSQRTNQFNLTDIRRRPGEIEALRQMYQILVIHVRDRFGDYGLVGSLFFRCVSSWIEVDTFVLSCRVLGRGVEHRVVKELGRIARQAGMKSIILRYRATPRSGPAREFLESSFDQFRAPSGDNYNSTADMVFTIPVDYAEGLRTQLPERTVAKKSVLPAEAMREAETGGSANWHEEAYRLSNLRDLVEEIRRSALGERRTRGAYTAPRTPTESSLSRIWAEVLGIEDISMDDDLLQLGADSLQAVRAISRIAAVLGVELPLTAVFDAPTVEKLAIAVEGGNSARSAHDELAAFAQNLRHNIEEMSDAEVLAGLADLERELNSESAMNS